VTAAVVGPSGTGKTTLAALVGRLTEPDEGEVLLDGIAVCDLQPADLRRGVAYAFARPARLGQTVADDIGYRSGPIARADIEHAARMARAHDFILRLPDGYDTPMADAPLSGGERQRLGIARALAADARVLVLDDATSSLDTATEAQVNAAIRELRADRTTLIVAHRASTAARADVVVWLHEGRVRGVAPHDQLWLQPAYRAVFGGAGGRR
jgi:ATP-binding cassette, subfamily B, bacterial